MSDTGFSPVRVELPLEPLEAFRLASFGIAYVPQYAEMRVDRHCGETRYFSGLGQMCSRVLPQGHIGAHEMPTGHHQRELARWWSP